MKLTVPMVALLVLLSGCGNRAIGRDGVQIPVVGVLQMTGGPVGASTVPVAGEVQFVDRDGRQVSVKAGTDGRFATRLKPGSYSVTGTSPLFNDGRGSCLAQGAFQVSEFHGTPSLTVSCPRR
jgi:hypothetical protein